MTPPEGGGFYSWRSVLGLLEPCDHAQADGFAGDIATWDLLHPLQLPAQNRGHVVEQQTGQDIASRRGAPQIVEPKALETGRSVWAADLSGLRVGLVTGSLNAAVQPSAG